MKLMNFISLSKHHTNLCNKLEWYSKWHKHPYHKHIHYFTFSLFVIFSVITFYNSHILKINFIQAEKAEKVDIEITNADEEKSKEQKDENTKEEKGNEDVQEEIILEEETLEVVDIVEPIEEETLEVVDIVEPTEEENEEIINIEEIVTFIEEQAENIPAINITDNENPLSLDLDKKDEEIKDKDKEEKEDKKDEKDEKENITEEPPIVPTLETATVLNVTSPIRNNKYRTGPISIHIVFSKIVEVSGTPTLSISTGNPSETLIDYASGSGTNTLNFIYKIASDNFSSDLDYSSVNSLLLNDGSIKDSDGNDASIVLPIPSFANSLSANKDIIIDTILRKPTVLHTPTVL